MRVFTCFYTFCVVYLRTQTHAERCMYTDMKFVHTNIHMCQHFQCHSFILYCAWFFVSALMLYTHERRQDTYSFMQFSFRVCAAHVMLRAFLLYALYAFTHVYTHTLYIILLRVRINCQMPPAHSPTHFNVCTYSFNILHIISRTFMNCITFMQEHIPSICMNNHTLTNPLIHWQN